MSTEDDDKVVEREQQLAREQRELIASLGEAGWRSPFFTGVVSDHPELASAVRRDPYAPRRVDYQVWREARDAWTQTGDRDELAVMEQAVSWVNPPERYDPPPPPAKQNPYWPYLLGAATAMAMIFLVILMLIVRLSADRIPSIERGISEATYRRSERSARRHGSGRGHGRHRARRQSRPETRGTR